MKISQLLTVVMVAAFSIATTAQKAVDKANTAFENLAYTEAAKLYKIAEPTVKDLDQKARILFQIGECERLSSKYSQAMDWYDKAIIAQYNNTNSEVHYNYGLCLENLERWDDAIAQYNKYTAKGGNKEKANARIAACKDVAEKKMGKQKFIVENMAELNTPFFDFCLRYSAKKGEQMMFTSSRQAAQGNAVAPITGESCEDIFFVDVDKKKKMSSPQPVAGQVNTGKNEGGVCFSKDYSEMYFLMANCDPNLPGPCDIYRSKKASSGWEEAKSINLIDRNADDTSSVGHPYLTPDNKYMLFVSDMPGGKGGADLWYATFDKKSDTWTKPTNMGAINTKGNEYFPYISEKDGSLYFSSDGHTGGLGGLDIYRAEKTGDISFSSPSALPYPINSTSNDYAIVLMEDDSDNGFAGYFTSNRPGGKGMDDLYKFTEPPLEFTFKGTAYNKETGSTLPGANVLISGSDGSSYKLTADGNGGFSLDKSQIKLETTYTVDVQKDKYLGAGNNFSTVGKKASANFENEFFLIPIIERVEYTMPLVLYVYDQTTLIIDDAVNSQDSLNYLLDLLQKNPKIAIQLEAHTDARGEGPYNQKLSDGRAKTCVDYLISKGIDPGRLKPVGKGENEPRTLASAAGNIPKGTTLTEKYIMALPEAEQEAAHTLNRRTIFRIIDTNYVPKGK
ncbi:MAG: OmpA family protein [Flavobacteriales bacterium]